MHLRDKQAEKIVRYINKHIILSQRNMKFIPFKKHAYKNHIQILENCNLTGRCWSI